MELLAIITALSIVREDIEQGRIIHLYTDSNYSKRCCTTYGEKTCKKDPESKNKTSNLLVFPFVKVNSSVSIKTTANKLIKKIVNANVNPVGRYTKIPDEIKKEVIDPYISIKNNEARINLRIKDSHPNK